MSRFLSPLKRPALWGVLLFLLVGAGLSAQESQAPDPGPKWGFGLTGILGTQTISGTSYEYLGLLPELSYGPFGVGFDLSTNFQFYDHPGGTFGFYPRKEDWWDSSLSTRQNIDQYLSRIAYLRWGHKGEPLYLQAGMLPSTTLGSGFIVGGYTNSTLRPGLRYIGVEMDADGALFGMPYGGFESFVGNVSALDVMGGRLYVKPLGILIPDNAFVKDIQFGVTMAADTNPYSEAPAGVTGSGSVGEYGADTLVPLYSSDWATALGTGDFALQGSHVGGSVGVGGKLLAIFHWALQNRFLGDNFLPDYFDQGYEANRLWKYQVYNGSVAVPGTIGWLASLGVGLLGDALTFGTTLSGPWTSQTNVYAQPQLQASAGFKTPALPLSLEAYYIKNGLTSLQALGSPENALIGAALGYTVGSVTLSILYNIRSVAPGETGTNGNNWVSTSMVQTSVKMF